MGRQVKTLVPGLTLPNGRFYPAAQTVVVLTDDEFNDIASAAFTANLLQDLGPTAGGEGGPTLAGTLFSIDDVGALPDGTTDNFNALMNAWEAMTASPTGGEVFSGKIGVYRFVLTPARVIEWAAQQYAAFPIPMRARTLPKLHYGIRGVGEAYTVRSAELAGTPGQVATSSVWWFDYDPDDFGWSALSGLPSIFGCTDADMTDSSGNTFSNVHFTLNNIILRNTPNPSLCMVNAEQVSTMRIGHLRIDVNAVLDQIPESTNPTGASLLLPRSNNNVAVQIDSIEIEGHYTGLPVTEHGDIRSAISLRNKIGIAGRRPCSHYSYMDMIKVEQCPWGIAGYNPQGAGPNLGVAAFPGATMRINFLDFEDYAYNGQRPDLYAPLHAHVYDPNNVLNGTIAFMGRVNSEPQTPPGVGIGTAGQSSSLYVVGASGTNSPIAIFGANSTAATRVAGTAPSNPAPPDAPTIGTATAGVESASVAFTPAGTGGVATSFTATSTPGGITGTGSSSPIVVSGLTAGQAYTFKVKATNTSGTSAESAASNSVTPTAPSGLPADNFNGANLTDGLGTSSSGHLWLGNTNTDLKRQNGKAEAVNEVTRWNPAWIDSGLTDMVVEAVIEHFPGECGIIGRLVDANNCYMLDMEYLNFGTATGALYRREGGSLTQLASGFTLSGLVAQGTAVKMKLKFVGTTVEAFVHRNDVAENDASAVHIGPITESAVNGSSAGIYSLVTSSPHRTFDNFVVSAP